MGIVVCNLQKHHTTGDGREAEQGQYRAFHFPKGRQPGSSHCCDKLNSTERDVEKHGVVFTKSKRLDDQGAECGNASTWDSTSLSAILALAISLDGMISRDGEHQCKPEP